MSPFHRCTARGQRVKETIPYLTVEISSHWPVLLPHSSPQEGMEPPANPVTFWWVPRSPSIASGSSRGSPSSAIWRSCGASAEASILIEAPGAASLSPTQRPDRWPSVLGVLLGRGCAESVSHWATAHQWVIRDPMEMVGGIPGKGWSVGWVSGSFQVTVTGAAQASPELPDCIMWV